MINQDNGATLRRKKQDNGSPKDKDKDKDEDEDEDEDEAEAEAEAEDAWGEEDENDLPWLAVSPR